MQDVMSARICECGYNNDLHEEDKCAFCGKFIKKGICSNMEKTIRECLGADCYISKSGFPDSFYVKTDGSGLLTLTVSSLRKRGLLISYINFDNKQIMVTKEKSEMWEQYSI